MSSTHKDDEVSERRLAENEVVFRQLNEQVQKSIDAVNRLAAESGQDQLAIPQGKNDPALHFYCECSEVQCTDRVPVKHHDYNRIHKRRDRFIIAPGHETTEIEKVISRKDEYTVVEKFITPPEMVGAIRNISTDSEN